MGRDGNETTTISAINNSINNNSNSNSNNMMNNSLATSISTSDTGAIGTCMMGAPAQTASIGYSDMMTFLPEGSNGAEQAQQQQADEDEIAQFSASLDELLATATTMPTTQTNAASQIESGPPQSLASPSQAEAMAGTKTVTSEMSSSSTTASSCSGVSSSGNSTMTTSTGRNRSTLASSSSALSTMQRQQQPPTVGAVAAPSQQVNALNPPPPPQAALPTYFSIQQQQQQQQQQQPQGPIMATTATSAAPVPSPGYTTQPLEQSCVSSISYGIAPPPLPPAPPSCSLTNTWPLGNIVAAAPSTATASATTTTAANSFPAVTSLPIAATGISYPPLPVVNNPSNPYNQPWTNPAQPTAQAQAPQPEPQQQWNVAPPPTKRTRTRKSTSGTKRRASSISTNKKTPLPVLTTPMTTLPSMGPQLQPQIKAVSEYDDSGTDDPSTSTSRHNYYSYSSPTTSSFMNLNNITSATSISESEKTKKRRQDRNLREQERAHRITEQITHLGNVLASANIRFKPDKYSTLISVVEYIKALQRRSSLLDDEHRKLLDTISRTGEMVNGIHHQHRNNNGAGGVTGGTRVNTTSTSVNYDSAAVVTRSTANTTTSNDSATINPGESTTASSSSTTSSINDDLMVFVRGVDYKSIFSNCGIALGVASVDGRFIDANDEFVYLSGYTRQELLGTASTSADVTSAAATSPLPPACALSSSSSETSTSDQRGGRHCMGGKHLSLFNLLSRDDMERVFSAMSLMLKSSGSNAGPPKGGENDKDNNERASSSSSGGNDEGGGAYVDEGNHWTGVVRKSRRRAPDIPLRLNITMVRSSDGRPKFFNCALTPEEDI